MYLYFCTKCFVHILLLSLWYWQIVRGGSGGKNRSGDINFKEVGKKYMKRMAVPTEKAAVYVKSYRFFRRLTSKVVHLLPPDVSMWPKELKTHMF